MDKETSRAERLLTIGTTAMLIGWVAIIGLSLAWSIYVERVQTQKIVINVADAYFKKDLAFRLWGTGHGGVYVPISETSPPNPYLAHVPERDIETPSGRKLTLMNPAYMIREMMTQFSALTGTSGHLTSLKLLNPINAPDEWERSVLEKFDRGVDEEIIFTEYKGEPHLRLMRPFVTKELCLKCHEAQGYKVGDIRGATSISIPLAPYYKIAAMTIRAIVITHVAILAIGILGIWFGSTKIRRYIRRHIAMEEDIRQQYAFTKTIINSLAHPLVVVNADTYEIVMANEAAERHGTPGARTCYELGHKASKPCEEPDHECPLAQVKKTKQLATVEHLHRDRDGAPVEMEVQCFPIFDENGGVKQVIEYSYDITARKRAEKEKLMLQRQLQQAQKLEAIGTIAGGIAHDFNNILSGILGYAQLAQLSLPKESQPWEYVDQIAKAGQRAAALVKQILSFARKTTLEISAQPVQVTVKETLNLLQVSLPKNIQVVLDIADDCGPVLIDPTQVHQIVMNLCTNAFHAMEKSGGTLEVRLHRVMLSDDELPAGQKLRPGPHLLLTVSDTGQGMDQETLRRIFDPFFTTKELGKGTGMGLSMVQGIVQALEAGLTVHSTPGTGSTFSIYFPVQPGNG